MNRIYLVKREAFAYLQHDFIRSEENVVLYNITTLKIALVLCVP